MTAAPALCPALSYERRRPERSALYQLLLRHVEPFLASNDVPSATAQTLRRFLRCGLLAAGFVRVRCPQCHKESLVAFSCKDRGFCPSCTARRAAGTAANLIDLVLPTQPYRQWVFVLPFALHVRVATDPELESKVLGLFIEELTEQLRSATDPLGEPGAVALSQHFGSTLNLHVHWHVLALDGVYVRHDDATLAFVAAPPPAIDALESLLRRLAPWIRALVGRAPDRTPEESTAPMLRLIAGDARRVQSPRGDGLRGARARRCRAVGALCAAWSAGELPSEPRGRRPRRVLAAPAEG